MTTVISFANHKGGVGKTTLAVSIADALSREGFDVLLIDLDPQGNATRLVYSFDETPSVTIEKILDNSNPVASAIVDKTRLGDVHLIGSTLKLSTLERHLQLNAFSSTNHVKDRLRSVMSAYDVVIFDTPPSLSWLTANAMAASDFIFIPVESGSKLSLIGTEDMLDFIHSAKAVNPKLQFGSAILTRHDARKKMCKITSQAILDFYERVLEHTLPTSTDVQKAQAEGKTILQYDRDHTASKEIVGMAREIVQIAGLRKAGEEVA
ncbi:MAG: ParA family protein [Candidatus Accumulibacter sp. UW20]|jgi:chromosome partitioning protein